MLDMFEFVEETPRFVSSFKTEMSGESAIDLFIDRLNPLNKHAHPALPKVMKEIEDIRARKGRGSSCTRPNRPLSGLYIVESMIIWATINCQLLVLSGKFLQAFREDPLSHLFSPTIQDLSDFLYSNKMIQIYPIIP